MEHKLHLYYGTGKGKTTAAMGLALRSLGHGQRVLVAQFMKRSDSGELTALRSFPSAHVYEAAPVRGFVSRMTVQEREAVCHEQTQMALTLAQVIQAEAPQTIVLDELALAWARGIVAEDAAATLLQAALHCGETVVTGRDAPPWLLEHADYISRIDAVRHPYQTEGLASRKGVEW